MPNTDKVLGGNSSFEEAPPGFDSCQRDSTRNECTTSSSSSEEEEEEEEERQSEVSPEEEEECASCSVEQGEVVVKAVSVEEGVEDLPAQLLEVLQVASCFGASGWTKRQLACALDQTSACKSILREAVERHIVVVSNKQYTSTSNDGAIHYHAYFEFATEELRAQIYQSIPQQQQGRSELHATIARRLRTRREGISQVVVRQDDDDDSDTELILVQQFLKGESSIQADEHYPIAALCLSTGKGLVRKSDFNQASLYLNFGVRLLVLGNNDTNNSDNRNQRCWHDEYDLSLALYQATAEVNYCVACFDEAEVCVHAVRENSRNFQDTHGVYATYVYVLGARGQREEAIATGLDVLKRMGEPLPSHPKRPQTLWNFIQTRRMLAGKSDEMLLRMPPIENDTVMATLRMLNLIFSHAFSSRPELVPLLVFRMVQLTVRNGLSVMSSVAFAKYGMVLCAMRLFADGERYAQLALTLFERFPVQEWLPRVYTGVYGGVYSSVKLTDTTLEPLRHAYRVGLLTGDIEFALIAAHVYAYNLFSLCRPLAFLEREMVEFCHAAEARKHELVQIRNSIFLQFIQNLRGKASGDPIILTGDIFDEVTNREQLTSDTMLGEFFHFYKLKLCFLFRDLNAARHQAEASRGLRRVPTSHVGFIYLQLFDALSALELSRKEGQGRRPAIRLTRDTLKALESRVLQNPVFCSGKLFLLQAELAWSLQQHDVAVQKFTCAIALSSQGGLLLDEGLSNECTGRYFLERGDKHLASSHFQQAHKAYVKWGATAKAEHLANEMARSMQLDPLSS